METMHKYCNSFWFPLAEDCSPQYVLPDSALLAVASHSPVDRRFLLSTVAACIATINDTHQRHKFYSKYAVSPALRRDAAQLCAQLAVSDESLGGDLRPVTGPDGAWDCTNAGKSVVSSGWLSSAAAWARGAKPFGMRKRAVGGAEQQLQRRQQMIQKFSSKSQVSCEWLSASHCHVADVNSDHELACQIAFMPQAISDKQIVSCTSQLHHMQYTPAYN